MNDVSQEKRKDSIMKSLAITGFIGIIILIAWLSVKLVGFVPGAFSSLASLAEGLNQKQESSLTGDVAKLTVTSSESLVGAGKPVQLSWSEVDEPGSFAFSYACAEGVAIDIQSEDGDQSIACDTNYNLGDTNSVSLSVDSEKERYVDVHYQIAFLGTDDTEPSALGTSSLTVMNTTIQDVTSDQAPERIEGSTETLPETTEAMTATEVEQEVASTVATEQPTVATTEQTPTYSQEYIYTIPTSDPNGRTDLSARFLNTGTIVGNVFFAGPIKQNESGAIQFEVKNYGTKTSDSWTFSVTLPSGGTYSSTEQIPLKPNEQALITVGFPTATNAGHTFVVTVDEATDRNSLNDRFVQNVTFVK